MKHRVWSDYDASSRDAEKRWRDPVTLHAAVRYVVFVIALVAVAFAATVSLHSPITEMLVPTILFVGTVGAFLRTYQAWRTDDFWVIWQGAGWLLLALFMFSLSVSTAVQ